MYNLSTVVKFEIARALKKPSFWVMAILMPIMLVLLMGFSGYSGYSGNMSLLENSGDTSDLKVALVDDSGLISKNPSVSEITKDIEVKTDKNDAVDQVEKGEINVLYFVPAEISMDNAIEIYTNTEDNSLFSNYTINIRGLLTSAAMVDLNNNQINILSNQFSVQTHTFIDGEDTNIIGKMIIPIIGLIIFYVLICLFGNRLMMSTLEEKENRISEMILTAIDARTLIVGKIVSLILLGFLQILILLIPITIFYLTAGNLNISGINIGEILSSITFDPLTIIYTILLLVGSYILFTGLCVLVGVIVPTAKEAGGFMGVVMISIIAPFMFFTSFLATDPSAIVNFLTFFPFSAPVALSMRNAFGTLPASEAIIGLVIIIIAAIIVIHLSIRLFRTSAMSYDARINIRKALKNK